MTAAEVPLDRDAREARDAAEREREPHLPLAEVDGLRGRRQVLDPQVALALVLLPEEIGRDGRDEEPADGAVGFDWIGFDSIGRGRTNARQRCVFLIGGSRCTCQNAMLIPRERKKSLRNDGRRARGVAREAVNAPVDDGQSGLLQYAAQEEADSRGDADHEVEGVRRRGAREVLREGGVDDHRAAGARRDAEEGEDEGLDHVHHQRDGDREADADAPTRVEVVHVERVRDPEAGEGADGGRENEDVEAVEGFPGDAEDERDAEENERDPIAVAPAVGVARVRFPGLAERGLRR